MLITLIRTFILYILVLFVIRVMGKSELSKMSPFQMVVIFMIAELAAIPIESPSASLLNGACGIISLLFLQVLISFLSMKSEKFKNLVNGKPSVLIRKGDIDISEMKKLRITGNDLLEQLRLANAPSPSDIHFAILEGNGQLSVIPKAEKQPLTAEDLCIVKGVETLPVTLVSDGVLYQKNIADAGLTENQLLSEIMARGITNIHDVFLAVFDEKQKIHVYQRALERSADGRVMAKEAVRV